MDDAASPVCPPADVRFVNGQGSVDQGSNTQPSNGRGSNIRSSNDHSYIVQPPNDRFSKTQSSNDRSAGGQTADNLPAQVPLAAPPGDGVGGPAAAPPRSNVPEYTVGELSGAIKRTLEGAFGRIRVRGEITELKLYGSGHAYLSLKDEGGKVRAVIWKSTLPRLGLRPENGVEVIATGKISAYGDRSEYQLVIDRLEYAGAGALLARIEMLRQRLAAEGLFDAAAKRALPVLPGVVGVITSPSGAVLHDIMTTVARRFARPILLWPVPVQGEGAATRIAAAIAGMDRLPSHGVRRPDVLIVARAAPPPR